MTDQKMKPKYATREDKFDFLASHCIFPPAGEQVQAISIPEQVAPARQLEGTTARLPLRQAATEYRRAFQYYRAMSIANPGHVSLPTLSTRLDQARQTLFESLDDAEMR